MSTKLYAPNLHLFAFHLCKAITTDENFNPHQLWQRSELILQHLEITERPLIYGYNYDYQPNHLEPSGLKVNLHPQSGIQFKTKLADQLTTGIIKFNRLYDSYALIFNIRHPEKDDMGQPSNPLSHKVFRIFNRGNKGIFLPDFVQSSLGQTLLLTAFLTDEQKQQDSDLKQLADQCLEAFIEDSEKRPKFNQKSEFLGATIFEYGQLLFDNESLNNEYCHVLIWFFSDEQSSEIFGKIYSELIDLFYFRNKIIKGFIETRKTYRKTLELYQAIEETTLNLQKHLEGFNPTQKLTQFQLKSFKESLKNLPVIDIQYSRNLRDFYHHLNTLEIHTHNYQETLKEIKLKAKEIKPDQKIDLSVFCIFSQENCPYFQKRIQADLNYFIQGSHLIDKAVASIRGIVEIDQAESDRSLERTIQILGAGLGAGGIAASSISAYIERPLTLTPKSNTDVIHPGTLTLILSFAIGAIAGTLVWLITGGYSQLCSHFQKSSN